jgi:glycosyltransferase involved in cell wall biosynthesis
MPPTVSINLCCYNSEKFLEETLQSIFAQTYKDWELVIVNDGSTDFTESIIKAYINRDYPIIYHYQENHGLGYSRNKALGLSSGEFIALLDHDDLWLPNKLEKQVELLDSKPDVALAYSDAYLIDSKGKILCRISDKTYLPHGNVLTHLSINPFIVCSTVLLRKRVLEEVGLFDTQLAVSEEYKLFLRIAERYEFEVVNVPLAKYRVHAGYTHRNIERAQEEAIATVKQCLAQNPGLEREVGRHAVKIRLAGLWCTLGQAYLLQGNFIRAREELGGSINVLKALPKALAFYALSFLGPNAVTALLKVWRSSKV